MNYTDKTQQLSNQLQQVRASLNELHIVEQRLIGGLELLQDFEKEQESPVELEASDDC